MKNFQYFIFIFIYFSLTACGHKSDRHTPNPDAARLNDSAIRLTNYIGNRDSAEKAMKLLDKATEIDSNYFLGYYNKLFFLDQLKQYPKEMNIRHRSYNMLAEYKAVSLLMLGQQENGNVILNQAYQNESDSLQKEWIHLLMNKNKMEVVDLLSHPKQPEAKTAEAVRAD